MADPMAEALMKSDYARRELISGPMRVVGRGDVGPTGDVIDVALHLSKYGDCQSVGPTPGGDVCQTHGRGVIEEGRCSVGRFIRWVLDRWDEGPQEESEGPGADSY